MLKSWYLNWQSERWLSKIRLVSEKLWGNPVLTLESLNGEVIQLQTFNTEYFGRSKKNHPEKFVITLDGKAVFESVEKEYDTFDIDYDPYEKYNIVRFNYGQWVNVVWNAYQEIEAENKRKEEVSKKALFKPLDE